MCRFFGFAPAKETGLFEKIVRGIDILPHILYNKRKTEKFRNVCQRNENDVDTNLAATLHTADP